MSSSDEEPIGSGTGLQKHETTATSRRKEEHPSGAVTESKRSPKTSKTPYGTSSVAIPRFVTDPNNPIGWLISTAQEFIADSIRLVRRCTKPDAREFKKIAYACAIGFLLMGFIGYVVKLIFIPINNIIVGG